MRGKYVFLLGFLLLKLMALVCKADGEPGLLGGFVMITTSNGSREEEVSASEETPHVEDKCRGYYDVMGQWDPPFICKTGNYLYCCGTCGFRFCCSYKHSRLDQSTCKNYDTPVWMKTGQTPYNKMNKMRDSTKDKTNLIVYIICGVVAIMALVGIFTKLGLEKAHRPQRENMSRAVASVLQGGCPTEQFRGEEGLGMTSQHFVSRTTNLQGGQVNNSVGGALGMGQPQHPYPALGQLAHVYDHQQQQQQPSKDLNKYASLKAVAAKYNGELYNKRRMMVELPSKGGLPMQPMGNSRQTMGNMTPPMSSNPMTSNPMTSNPMSSAQMNHSMAQMMPMTSMTQMTSMTSMPHMTSMTPMTSLSHMTSLTPMTSLGPLTPEPVATYTTLPTERHMAGGAGSTGQRPNGQKLKSIHTHPAHSAHSHPHGHSSKPPGMGGTTMAHMSGTMPGSTSLGMSRISEASMGTATMGRPFAYNSNTISASHTMGLGIKGWDGTETVGRRKAYGHKRPQCTVLEPNQLHGTRGQSRSQHFLPTQPYFVTNSKTEVTV